MSGKKKVSPRVRKVRGFKNGGMVEVGRVKVGPFIYVDLSRGADMGSRVLPYIKYHYMDTKIYP